MLVFCFLLQVGGKIFACPTLCDIGLEVSSFDCEYGLDAMLTRSTSKISVHYAIYVNVL